MAWLQIYVDYARAWNMIHRADLKPDIESFSCDTADFLTTPIIAYNRTIDLASAFNPWRPV
jgi:hypothetical protein